MKQINVVVKEINQEGYVTLLAKSMSKEWTLEKSQIPILVKEGSWLQLTLEGHKIVMIEMDQEDIVASRMAVDRKWQRLQDKRNRKHK